MTEPKRLVFDEENHTYTVDGVVVPSVTDICGIIPKLGIVPSAIINQAARRGSLVHELCQLVDYGCDKDGIPCPPDLVGYVLAYMRFTRDYKPEWEMIEHKLYSPHFEYAGTLDRYGKIDGKPVLLDIKTSTSPNRPTLISWACQLAGYADLLDTPGPLSMVDLQLKKNGTYRVIDVAETEKKFKFNSFQLFHELRGIYWLSSGRVTK
jgi:hypothetical protein